jgi:hypothetical protein
MKIEKRTLVEVEFSDRESEILRQAQDVIIQLINSTDGHLLVDQLTGECFDRQDLKNVAIALGNLAYNGYSNWLFEMN